MGGETQAWLSIAFLFPGTPRLLPGTPKQEKMSDQPAVRVARSHLENYSGRTVRLVGTVVNNDGATAILQDAEGQKVNITKVAGPYDSSCVEVIGTVQPDMSIETMRAIDLGNSFNMENYNEVLKLAHGSRVRSLFE